MIVGRKIGVGLRSEKRGSEGKLRVEKRVFSCDGRCGIRKFGAGMDIFLHRAQRE